MSFQLVFSIYSDTQLVLFIIAFIFLYNKHFCGGLHIYSYLDGALNCSFIIYCRYSAGVYYRFPPNFFSDFVSFQWSLPQMLINFFELSYFTYYHFIWTLVIVLYFPYNILYFERYQKYFKIHYSFWIKYHWLSFYFVLSLIILYYIVSLST